MESFLVNYFRKPAQTKNIIKRKIVELVYATYLLILYIPLRILQGLLWFIEKGTGTKLN